MKRCPALIQVEIPVDGMVNSDQGKDQDAIERFLHILEILHAIKVRLDEKPLDTPTPKNGSVPPEIGGAS